MTEEETRDQRYKRQTSEQFEAIGRFVQAFEQMVGAARFALVQILTRNVKQQQLWNIVFHHSAMSALPLMDILRSIIGELMRDKDNKILKDERTAAVSIMKQLNIEYADLASNRNDLLHGTWYIGWAGAEQTDFSEINVDKFKAKATGLELVPPPADIEAMRALVIRCDKIAAILREVAILLIRPDGVMAGKPGFTKQFKKIAVDKWSWT